jgi:diguanylate cyclase (GGDEF)-like protein
VAGKLADFFREKVKQLEDDVVGQVTISSGVAQWNASESVDELIKRADQALYKAKNAGRNRVFLA